MVLMGDYLLQLRGKSHILVLFTVRLTRFLLEIDGRVPGISTFEGLVVGSGVSNIKKQTCKWMTMGRDIGTDEERSLYYKFRNKRHKALTIGNSKA